MTQFKHKSGTGSLFPNQKKNTQNHPDFTGKIILSKSYQEGDELRFVAWQKPFTNGTFLSISENTYDSSNATNEVKKLFGDK